MKETFFIILLLTCIGCSSTNITTTNAITPEQKSNLTVGMIKKKVIRGKTTQNEVMTLFGAPNIITTNTRGNEVWNYNKSSYQAGTARKKMGWDLLLLGSSKSSALSNTSTASMDLIITFNPNGIVEDYKIISSTF